MREALAVQAFEEGLKGISLVDHPSEYAMLQNNLGNALQYVSSSHRVENGFRALEAYDEALRVRTKPIPQLNMPIPLRIKRIVLPICPITRKTRSG